MSQLLCGWVLSQVVWLLSPRVCAAPQRPREKRENALEFLQHFLFQRIQTAFHVILRVVNPSVLSIPQQKYRARASGQITLVGAPSRWRYLSSHHLAAQSAGLTASAESFPALPHSLLSPPPHGARDHVTSRRPMGEQRGRAGPCGRH